MNAHQFEASGRQGNMIVPFDVNRELKASRLSSRILWQCAAFERRTAITHEHYPTEGKKPDVFYHYVCVVGWNEASGRCWRDAHPWKNVSCEHRARWPRGGNTRIPILFLVITIYEQHFRKMGGWVGPHVLPISSFHSGRFLGALRQGDCHPLRAILPLISCSSILNPTCVRVCLVSCIMTARRRWKKDSIDVYWVPATFIYFQKCLVYSVVRSYMLLIYLTIYKQYR